MKLTNKELKDMHDLMLSIKPENASHTEDDCLWCSGEEGKASKENTLSPQGGDMDTFTKEQLDAAIASAVAEAVASRDLELSELKAAATVEEATSQYQGELATLQADLDAAKVEAEAERQAKEEILAFLDEAAAEAEQAKQLATLRDERKDLVSKLELFNDEHVETNADRWASMEEDAFMAQIDDWKVIKAASKEVKEPKKSITASSMKASHEVGSANPQDVLQARADFFASRQSRQSIRNL